MPSIPLLRERRCHFEVDQRGLFVRIDFGDDGEVLIDTADYESVRNRKWTILRNAKRPTLFYVLSPPSMLLHRLLMNAPKGGIVDHEDGNGLNCRRYNLRNCTDAQNQSNYHLRDGSSYGRGVYPTGKRFYSTIQIDSKLVYLGTFDTPEEAAAAWNKAATEARGEFTQLNDSMRA